MASCTVFRALIVLIFAFYVEADVKRNVKITLWPDCASYEACENAINSTDPDVSVPNVAYVRAVAVGREDVLHFVMSTVDVPSVLVVHTLGDSSQQLNFNWTRLLATHIGDMKGAIFTNTSRYHGSIKYSFALTFTKLIEYDDISDGASLTDMEKLNDSSLWNVRNFSEFVWQKMSWGKDGQSIVFNTTQPQPEPYGNNTNGSLSFEFEFNNGTGRDSDLPRLIFNSNNTQMNFALDRYVPTFNQSRFALEMVMVANYSSQNMSFDEFRSIDDEYSPGVFRVVNWYTAGESNPKSGYMQWKPVCYLAETRSRSVGTEVTRYPLQKTSRPGGGLAQAFYGAALDDRTQVVMKAANVSFGLSQDGFYLKNNYTVWTASLGYGTPPVEGISTMVIIIIAAGLGIPVIIIIFGGIYVCARKKRHDGYEDLSRSNPRMN